MISDFGMRISDFAYDSVFITRSRFRMISDFGMRISDFVLSQWVYYVVGAESYRRPGTRNPKSAFRNPKSFLPFSFCLDYDATFQLNSLKNELFNMSQSQPVMAHIPHQPLTTLSEDEQMFRSSVREFAEGELRPRVEKMDEAGKLDPAIIRQCFDLGLMGIETPEEYGGAGANFFTAILAVEELSRVDGSVGVLVDVQNTLVNNALLRWTTDDQKKRYLPRMVPLKD